MRGVIGPPGHAEIDLCDGTVTVAAAGSPTSRAAGRRAACRRGSRRRGRARSAAPSADAESASSRARTATRHSSRSISVVTLSGALRSTVCRSPGSRRAAQQPPGEPEHGEADGRSGQAARCQRHARGRAGRRRRRPGSGCRPGGDVSGADLVREPSHAALRCRRADERLRDERAAAGSGRRDEVPRGRKRRRDPGSTENRGSAKSPRSTTADRASMTSSALGMISRPTADRTIGVASTKIRSPADREATRPVDDPLGPAPDEVEESRADHAEGRDAHRSQRPVKALRQADAEEDAGVVSGQRRTAHGDRIQRRDRPGLRQPQPSVGVDGPFDVLRAAERALDPVAERRQRSHLRVGQAGRRRVSRVAAPPVEDPARRRVDDEVIGVDRAGHHRVAEASRGIEDRLPAPARHRIGGEQHARRLGIHHPLHDHGQRDSGAVDTLGGAVRDRPVGPQRRPAAMDGVEHLVDAGDVEVGVLLAGEARAGEVLRGGRRSHGDRAVGARTPSGRRPSLTASATGLREGRARARPRARPRHPWESRPRRTFPAPPAGRPRW